MLSSMAFVSIGLLRQFLHNRRRRNCEGVEPLTFILLLIVYASWSLYGWTKPGQPDWFMSVPMTLGAIMSIALTLQYVYYTLVHHQRISVSSSGLRRATRVLCSIFRNDVVFLKRVTAYSAEERSMTGEFVLPQTHIYTFRPIDYVSASEKLACGVQLIFVLVCSLAADGVLAGSTQHYEQILQRHQMRLRQVSLDVTSHIPKNHVFVIAAKLAEVTASDSSRLRLLLEGDVSGEVILE